MAKMLGVGRAELNRHMRGEMVNLDEELEDVFQQLRQNEGMLNQVANKMYESALDEQGNQVPFLGKLDPRKLAVEATRAAAGVALTRGRMVLQIRASQGGGPGINALPATVDDSDLIEAAAGAAASGVALPPPAIG